ncbi:hypothetical protein R1sor_004147 [Riccia sorocarpa]|uniref:Bulb-type lectin domain-containing protein n=1 Tax=Riccia sorocarpa TaxID=122646 RepID=A0ABD3H6Z3_9MARC
MARDRRATSFHGALRSQVAVFLLSIVCQLAASQPADRSTLLGKVMFGYQGWFLTPNDGGNVGWRHWSGDENVFDNSTATIDLWPDMSEYEETEATSGLHYANGDQVKVFSSLHRSTVNKHFEWIRDYQLDGVFLQRFLGEVNDRRFFFIRNNVTLHVMAAAETYGRTFSIMYDISGVSEASLVQSFKDDWNYLSQTLHVTQSSAYQLHQGRPVVAIWGFGFNDSNHPATPAQAIELINFLHAAGCFVIGGVPFWWRDGNRDSRAGYMNAYLAFDALSPWAVGRWSKPADYENPFEQIYNDERLTFTKNKLYAPVLWPGGSNGHASHDLVNNFNGIPRLGGQFFTKQTDEILLRLRRNKTFIFIAMYDEIDEGTAMFKAAERKEDTPADGTFLYLDIDGISLSSDHYLQLASDLKSKFDEPVIDRLSSNGVIQLQSSACFPSASSVYRLCMQGDGNLVIYSQADNSVLWALGGSSHPEPFTLFMQGDGNVVIYDGQSVPIFAASNDPFWAARISKSTGPYQLILQDDGNLIAYDSKQQVVWMRPETNEIL